MRDQLAGPPNRYPTKNIARIFKSQVSKREEFSQSETNITSKRSGWFGVAIHAVSREPAHGIILSKPSTTNPKRRKSGR